jgi:hypothetical protein
MIIAQEEAEVRSQISEFRVQKDGHEQPQMNTDGRADAGVSDRPEFRSQRPECRMGIGGCPQITQIPQIALQVGSPRFPPEPRNPRIMDESLPAPLEPYLRLRN